VSWYVRISSIIHCDCDVCDMCDEERVFQVVVWGSRFQGRGT